MPVITSQRTPAAKTIYSKSTKFFRGVDYSNHYSNVDMEHTPNGENFIRDVPGCVVRRTGYYVHRTYADKINGIYALGARTIVHAGAKLYIDAEEAADRTELYTAMADARSYGILFCGKLWILDGTAMIVVGDFDNPDYDENVPGSEETLFEAKTAQSIAYVPTITIGCAPGGGGTTHEAVNMLTPSVKEAFLGTANTTAYHLTFDGIGAAAVTARVKNSSNEWVDKQEDETGTPHDFSVDRTTGVVTFHTAPGAPPVTGEDNVEITYQKGDTNDYPARVNKCRFGICYGVEAASDRIFIAGNPDYRHYAFYCGLEDATYWPDLGYCIAGQEQSPIIGFSRIKNDLAMHKQNDDNDCNIVTWYGKLDEDGDPEFLRQDIIQGAGAIAPHSFEYIREPLFLTADGICAATPYILNAERYVQNRSFNLNKRLAAESGLEDAVSCVWREFYMLCVNGHVYILDTLVQSEGDVRNSAYQYEAYYWTNVAARVMTVLGDELLFGRADGKICKFYTDTNDNDSYNDDGDAIPVRWDTSFTGKNESLKKSIVSYSVRCKPASKTSFELWVQKKGIWRLFYASSHSVQFWDFDNVDFDNIVFSTDTNPRTVSPRIKLNRFDGVRISIRNEKTNEPFGLFQQDVRFSEGSVYRG